MVGNAIAITNNARVASFEAVYGEAITGICSEARVPSLSSVAYGKGWGMLATHIRTSGWPPETDVLVVSKYLSKGEVLMELRLLADVIIE